MSKKVFYTIIDLLDNTNKINLISAYSTETFCNMWLRSVCLHYIDGHQGICNRYIDTDLSTRLLILINFFWGAFEGFIL